MKGYDLTGLPKRDTGFVYRNEIVAQIRALGPADAGERRPQGRPSGGGGALSEDGDRDRSRSPYPSPRSFRSRAQ